MLDKTNFKYLILVISFFFCLLVGFKFYGFGNDYYAVYQNQNYVTNSKFDFLGWKIATFALFDNHYGVYLTSFILSLSSGFLLNKYFEISKFKSITIFLIIYIFIIHSWPIIMSTSNAMRQGLCMSFLFWFFYFTLEKKKFKSFLFLILALFTHKSGLIFFYIYIFLVAINLSNYYFQKYSKIILIFYSILIYVIIYKLLDIQMNTEEPSRVIRGDYRIHFFFINLSFMIFHLYFIEKLIKNNISLFLYLSCLCFLAVLQLGLSWQYERLNMMLIIPFILSLGMLFNRKSRILFWTSFFFTLFLFTLYSGVYSSLV